tara:strand:+ start:4454 stop:4555 length:102 start_codon:yes stop_codon:yes gene_type:complete
MIKNLVIGAGVLAIIIILLNKYLKLNNKMKLKL